VSKRDAMAFGGGDRERDGSANPELSRGVLAFGASARAVGGHDGNGRGPRRRLRSVGAGRLT